MASTPSPRQTVATQKKKKEEKGGIVASSFGALGLREEVMGALKEMGISVPTEIQSIDVPVVLQGENVVLRSHTGSGKTMAYMLPLVQVFRVAKSISHHARFRSTMISGGGCSRPQEDSLNVPIDMIVGTPGRILRHIEDGNIAYGDIKYLVLDEVDTMIDKGFGLDIRKQT